MIKNLQKGKFQENLVYAGESNEQGTDQGSEHPTKRRRLSQKPSPAEIAHRFADTNWQAVMQAADRTAPRVGPLVVEEGSLLQMVQTLCPEHSANSLPRTQCQALGFVSRY